MTKSIDFYFDFISPYSFIAHKKIKYLNQNNKLNIKYKPILLGGLHNLGGITAPAFNERKMKNMKNDCNLIAAKNNIEFKWNDKFPINSLYLMRGYISIEQNCKEKYLDICFDAYWKDNIDISHNESLDKILKKSQIDKEFFFKKINEKKIKDELKKFTSNAFEIDIFGAPTFIVNEKIFWGQDRLEYAIEELDSN